VLDSKYFNNHRFKKY